MINLLVEIFTETGFLPHRFCINGSVWLLNISVISNSLIFIAYFSIPVALAYITYQRKELKSIRFTLWLFAAFILADGTTHLLHVITFWQPWYWLQAMLDMLTAIISVITAIYLWPLLHKLLNLPSPEQLLELNRQLQLEINERKTVEETLRQEISFSKTLINSLPGIYYRLDAHRRLVEWNDTFATLLGEEGLTIAKANVLDIIADNDKTLIANKIAEGFANGYAEAQAELKLASGKYRSFYFIGKTLNINEHVYLLGTGVDISERKQIEKALQESEYEFRTLSEAMPQIVWVTRADGWNTYFNQQWMDYTGLTLKESLGHGWNIPFHPDDKKRAWDAWQAATQTDGEYNLECRLRCADGTYHWWLIRGVPLHDADGKILKWFGTCTDIEDIKRTEINLLESEKHYRTLVNNIPDYVMRYDQHYRHIFANDRVIKDSGKTKDEFIGKTLHETGFPKQLCTLCEAALERCFTTQTPQTEVFEWENALGVRVVEWRGVPEYSSEGLLETVLAIARDITKHKQDEDSLQQIQLELREAQRVALIGSWSLDIKTNTSSWSSELYKIYDMEPNSPLPPYEERLKFYTPKSALLLNAAVENTIQTGEPYELDLEKNCSGGQCRWVIAKGEAIRDASGQVLSLRGTVQDITERKLMENNLKASEARFRSIIDISPIPLALNDEQQNITYLNPSFVQTFGYDLSDIPTLKEWWLKAYPDPEYRQSVSNTWQTTLAEAEHEHQPFSPLELEIRCKNGELKTVLVNASAISDTYNCEHLVVLYDITERIQTEEVLKLSEARYRFSLEVTGQIGWSTPADGAVEDMPLWREFTGQSLEEVKGWKWLNALHPDDRESAYIAWNDATAQKCKYETEYRVRRADGVYRNFMARGIPLYNTDGSCREWIGTCIDITEHKQAELEKLATEEQLRAFYELDLIGLAITSPEKGWVRVNHYLCNMLQYSEQEFHGMTWTELTYPEDLAADVELFEKLLTNKIETYSLEKRFVSRSGIIIPTQLVVRCVRKTNGEVDYVLAMVEDISKRKQAEKQLLDLNRDFVTFLENTSDYIYFKDQDSRIRFCSQTLASITHHDSWRDLIGKHDAEIFSESNAQIYFEEELPVFEQGQPLLNRINPYYYEDGTVGWLNTSKWPVFDVNNQNVVGIVGITRDITQLKQAEMELHIAATVFESQEGMLITDANGIILKVNHAFTLITGYSAAEVIGKTPRILSSGQHDNSFYELMWQHINANGAWQGEIWNRRKNGDCYPEWLTVTAVKNQEQVTHYVATLTDITERKATEEQINHLAFYDPLTQLPNRRLLQERLKHGIEVSRRTGNPIAVLMMDLDKFKAVNDNLGHAAGDELLQQVAIRIKTRLREMDMVARLGGDEFVVLLEDIEHEEYIGRIADNIIQDLSQPFTLCKTHDVYIGASIGIGIYPHHGNTMERLMDNADTALYHAKAQGRGCFAYFSESLTQQTRERIALETRLRQAIEQNQLRVCFQPQIDIASGQIVGAEALVRWHDPINGLLMPKDFIALAEETSLIVSIGEWVLTETCKFGRQWLDQGLPMVTLSVNVSPYQFRRCDINALVSQVLKDTGFPAEYLELEITETGLMENQENAMSIMDNLQEQGVRLAIDDFGTGYSSLAYLKFFPVDVLKIDKTFIDDIPFSESDMAITSTIIAMAHLLGFKVLAEGVETKEQLEFLLKHDCDRYQGYLYSEAISANAFADLLFNSRATP